MSGTYGPCQTPLRSAAGETGAPCWADAGPASVSKRAAIAQRFITAPVSRHMIRPEPARTHLTSAGGATKIHSSVYAIWRGGIRMKTKLALGTAALGLLLAAVPVMAHHSFAAEFDSNKPIKMTGSVTKIEWMNPHAYFYIDVKDEKTGATTNWGLEMGSPNGLMRQGWTR